MKIGLVRRGYSATGGAENYLRRFAVALRAAGHDAVFFGPPEWPEAMRPAGVEFVPVPGRSPRAFSDALETLRPRERGLCDLLFSLERITRCDCYRAGDGVHRAWQERRAAVGGAVRPSALQKFQTALRPWNPKHRQLLALEAALFAPNGSGARAVIANCRLVAGEITEHYGYPPARVRVIPNGLPAAAFEPLPAELSAAARREWGLADDDYAVLFAGSGWERKGLGFAINAVAALDARQRAVLLVAGSGTPRMLPALTAESARRVRFLGPVSGQLMRSLLAAADVFLLPTIYDPFSNACLEAFAAGLPVITTAQNGFAEALLPTQTGEVVSRADALPELVQALGRWADAERRQAARPHIREAASRYTIEANVAATLDFLTHLPPAPAGS
jgi:UDP-glucose:(heptosyl)LPS alpha-1,3-glucosyltransferase